MSPIVSLDKTGIFLSKPIAFVLVLVYLIQSTLLIYLIKDKYELHQIIDFQRDRLEEMEEQLKIFQVIEDFQIGFSEKEKVKLAGVIWEESKRYNYDPLLLMAVILSESSLRKGQVSEAGAQGLMQLLPSVGRDLADRSGIEWQGQEPLFDPVVNIRLGTLHLFEQILKFRDFKKALVAYNMGEGRLRGRLAENKPLPGRYLRQVREKYVMLKEKYDS